MLDDVVILERIRVARDPIYRPPLPQRESEGVHPGILTLMKQCWTEEPSERPSFKDVMKTLRIINDGKLEYCIFTFWCTFLVHLYKRRIKTISPYEPCCMPMTRE